MPPRTWIVVASVIALAGQAAAQPYVEQVPASSTSVRGSDTKIPIRSGEVEVLGAEGTASASSPPPVALEQPIDPNNYVCGPGDMFELNFWGQQNFRLRIAADVEGRTFISKVGYLDVAGKTLTEVRTQAKKKVRQSYPGLQVDLALVAPRSFLVHLVNYVKQPGTYSANALERVSTVLARAG